MSKLTASLQGLKRSPKAWNIKRTWIKHREDILEFFRIKFHTYFVAIWMAFNMLFVFPSGIVVYLSRFMHHHGDPVWLLQQIGIPYNIFMDFTLLFFIPFDQWAWWDVAILTYQTLFVWLYSTITVPIKSKKHKDIINFTTTTKGRIWAAVLCALPFLSVVIGYAATKTDQVIWKWATSIVAYGVDLKFNSMESFGYFVLLVPLGIAIWAFYLIFKIIYREQDVREIFLTWEFPPLARLSFSLTGKDCDIIIGWEDKTNKPLVLRQNDRMLHGLTLGPTGSGKTSTSLIIQVVQDMVRMAQGKKMGIVILEPKGDFIRDAIGLAEKLGISDKVKLIDPEDLAHSMKFNPLSGPDLTVASTFRGTFDALAGKQDAFFKGQQNEATMMLALLAKARYEEKATMEHVRQMITDPRYLADIIVEMQRAIENKESDPSLTEKEKVKIKEYKKLVHYFEDEVIQYVFVRTPKGPLPDMYPEGHRHYGKQKVENKKDGYISGVKQNINDLSMNPLVSELMTPEEGVEMLDLDNFLAEGGILLVNTGMGSLDSLHKILGQFFIRQFQAAVFRRPLEGRIPVFLMVDEFANYMNEGFADFVSLARSYKVGAWVAFQSIGQLDEVSQGYSTIILNSARNQMIYGGSGFADAEVFSNQFGETYMVEESLNESTTPLSVPSPDFGYRYNTMRKLAPRFTPTDLRELKLKEFVAQIVVDGTVRPPVKAKGRWIQETRFLKKFLNVGGMDFELNKKQPDGTSAQAAPMEADKVVPVNEPEVALEQVNQSSSENKEKDYSNVVPLKVGNKVEVSNEEGVPQAQDLSSVSLDNFIPNTRKEKEEPADTHETDAEAGVQEEALPMSDEPIEQEQEPVEQEADDALFDDPTLDSNFVPNTEKTAPHDTEDVFETMIKLDKPLGPTNSNKEKESVKEDVSSNVSMPDDELLEQVSELHKMIKQSQNESVQPNAVSTPPKQEKSEKPKREKNHQKKNPKPVHHNKVINQTKSDDLNEEQFAKEQADAMRKQQAKIERRKKEQRLHIPVIEDSVVEDI